MVTIALTHIPQESLLLQHLVSLVVPFCVDQSQSDRVGSDFLHQSKLLMSVHFEKKNFASRGPPDWTMHMSNVFIADEESPPSKGFKWRPSGVSPSAPWRLSRTVVSKLAVNVWVSELHISHHNLYLTSSTTANAVKLSPRKWLTARNVLCSGFMNTQWKVVSCHWRNSNCSIVPSDIAPPAKWQELRVEWKNNSV